MATSQPLDALGPQALSFLYKDLKDNRQVPASFIALLEKQVGANAACNIDDFMKVVNKAEGIVIRCYRKLVKLLPGKFVKTEILDKDIRQDQATIANILRDFLLWNQGIPVNTGVDAATPDPVNNPAAIPAGLIMVNGRLVQTVTSGPMVKKAEPAQRLPPPAPAPVYKPQVAAAEASNADKRIQLVKIQPSQLWKNASLPTKSLAGCIDLSEDPLSQQQPAKGKGKKRAAADQSEARNNKRAMTDFEIIDLLLEDPFDDFDSEAQPLSALEFGQVCLGMPAPSPAKKSPQHAEAPKPSAHANKSQPVSKASNAKQQQQQVSASAANASKKVQSAQEVMLTQSAAHLAMATGADATYAKQVLTECGGNIPEATRRLQQYVVDLEEARIMDQARLASESTAANDKMRAQADREQRIATSQAMAEFADSELLKQMQLVRTFLSRNESALTSDGISLRKSIVRMLDEEKKAIKWYKDSARAYMRQLPSRLHLAKTPTEFFQQELAALKDILYSTASESGAPTAFLAALDAETAKAVRPGQVLGVSKDTPVELI